MAEKKKVGNLDLGSIDDMLTLAEDIKKFIKENRLFQNVQGKEYVNVEGWMYAGSRLGLTSYVDDIENISTDDEIKYKAKVVVERIEDGRRMGQGFAICSNKEQGKKYYQEYAIASMAQTRGVSKAYRMFLAQLIRMAGFEPTPAEEMDYEGAEPAKKEPKQAKAEPVTAPPMPGPLTPVQKKKLVELLNNELITQAERTKMLPMLDKMNTERAAEATLKLQETIKGREAELQEQAGN